MEESEGGWMLEVVGENFIASTGKWMFRGGLKPDTTTPIQKVQLTGKPIRSVALGPGVLFTAGDEKVLEARDDKTLEVKHTSPPYAKKLGKIYLLNPDASQILVADKTGDVFMTSYDAKEGFSAPKFFIGHTASMITGLTTCLSNKIIVTTDKDEHIRFTRNPAKEIVEAYAFGHVGFISTLQKLSDNIIATGGGDGLIKIWDVPSAKCLFTDSLSATCTINCLTFDSSSSTLFAAIEGIGIISYQINLSDPSNIVKSKSGVVATRVASQIVASSGILIGVYIGETGPFVERFSTEPIAAAHSSKSQVFLSSTPIDIGSEITTVKPSYWQSELDKKRTLRAGIDTPSDIQRKKAEKRAAAEVETKE